MRRAHACGNCNLTASIYHLPFSRGHSSVGRAPALQAGSQGFESPCLQSLIGVEATSITRYIIGCTSRARNPLASRPPLTAQRRAQVCHAGMKCRRALITLSPRALQDYGLAGHLMKPFWYVYILVSATNSSIHYTTASRI